MRHRRLTILLAGLLTATTIGGCSLLPGVEDERPSPLTKPIVCRDSADCQGKWSRAAAWIAENSNNQIKIQNDSTIQSMDPIIPGSSVVYTATKLPGANGVFEISFHATCGNQSSCNPPITEARASFERYVQAMP
jgi:hypothetical protein